MVRESNSPGTSAPTVSAGLRLCRTAHHPCQCFQYGAHRPSLAPSWERFSCGVRGVGRIRTSGGLRPCCFRDSRIRPLCHYSTDPHEGTNRSTYSCGSRAPGGIRTHDHKVRTLLLWSAELQEQGGWPGGSRKIDNPFQRSNFALVICFQTGHPRLFEVVFSSAVRLQGSWNMPYLSIKEERNQARQSEEYPLKSFQSECEKVSTDSAP